MSQILLRKPKGENCQNQMSLELDESNILKQTIVSSRVTSHQCITWSVGISVATHSESLDGFCLSHTIILHTKCSILLAVTSCTFVLRGSSQDLKVRITPIYNPIIGENKTITMVINHWNRPSWDHPARIGGRLLHISTRPLLHWNLAFPSNRSLSHQLWRMCVF